MYRKLMQYLGLGMLALGFTALASSPSHAVFAGISRSTMTASATPGGVAIVQFNPVIKLLVSSTTATSIAWTGVNLPAGWDVADHFIELHSTLTLSGSAIQVYTNNMASDAVLPFTGVPSTKDPAGLVDQTDTTQTLSVAWSIKPPTDSIPTAEDPNSGQPAAFQWLFMKDRSTVTIGGTGTTAFADGQDFVTVRKGGLIHSTQGAYFSGPSPSNMYLQANFAPAQVGRTYKTTTLRLESFTQ